MFNTSKTNSNADNGININKDINTDARFQKLIENSYEGITLLDGELNVIYRSPSAERISGWNNATYSIVSFTDLIHPEDSEKVKLLIKEILANFRQPKTMAYRIRHFDGHYIWVQSIFTNYLDESDIAAIVLNWRDITLEKEVILESYNREQDLQNSNERFEYATEATTDVIWDWDLDTNMVYYSGNMQKLFGHKAEKNNKDIFFFTEHVHPDDRDRVILQSDDVKFGTFINWAEEYRFKKANGEYAFVMEKAVVLRDKHGLGKRMVGAMQDITKQKLEERRLKLLESVVTNTTDSILITKAEPFDFPGPEIIYVNEAFTKMTGYAAVDVIGKTPRILQGPKTDKQELQRLKESMQSWSPCEITVINYKKNGEEFWINISVIPVADETGLYTHWISNQKDITQKKNEELQNTLLAEISQIFANGLGIRESLNKSLQKLVEWGNFSLAEFWLVDTYRNKIALETQFYKSPQLEQFANQTLKIEGLEKGKGFPGVTWASQNIEYWNYKEESQNVRRYKETAAAGIKRAYSLPLFYNGDVIGTLALLMERDENPDFGLSTVFENFSQRLGAEIKRKQLEEELNQVFLFTPDILCMANIDGYFIKINPAMSALLEYSEEELLTIPFMDLVHPLDKEKTGTELRHIIDGTPSYYIENRYITKSGKIKWLAWTTTGASEKGILFCSAKDITEKKEVEVLLNKANVLARIGAWEVDMASGMIHWSDITREIHEVEPDFNPDIESGLNFYAEGYDRNKINEVMIAAVRDGKSADLELKIITAKGNAKWIRVIVDTEFENGKYLRLYGSFQDIDVRKKAELMANEALEERNVILESIGDAFFAVDKNWVVTYWNNMAEKVFQRSKEEMINRNFWDVSSNAVNSKFYSKYNEAMETNKAVHFEDYYLPLNMWFEASIYPSFSGLSIYFRDITDRKKAEKSVLELNENLKIHAKELAISNAELEQFAYVASHDLQEPLRMVTSFLTQIERKYGQLIDDKGRQYIHFAVDGAKRMRQIILDLLEFSRVGREENDVTDVDLNNLISEINALLKKQIQELKATILFNDLPIIQTFKTPIRQVLLNLISNGLKYHRKGVPPVINITCEETDVLWIISVEDNGIGIKKDYFDKIFIIFQRLHNTSEFAGTGMGLAIAKKIIENAGGKIWLTSGEGKGTIFNFTILKNK